MVMALQRGIEPRTLCSSGRCYYQLSYHSMCAFFFSANLSATGNHSRTNLGNVSPSTLQKSTQFIDRCTSQRLYQSICKRICKRFCKRTVISNLPLLTEGLEPEGSTIYLQLESFQSYTLTTCWCPEGDSNPRPIA